MRGGECARLSCLLFSLLLDFGLGGFFLFLFFFGGGNEIERLILLGV